MVWGVADFTPPTAHAQTDTTITSSASLEQARGALSRGDAAEADRLLSLVDEQQVDINDVDFLRGMVAMEKKEYRRAAEIFDRILARDARLNRVRLELARARYMAGDESEAERQFRAAIAAGVPLAVARNIAGFLGEIRRRRHWDFDFGAGIAADSNVNLTSSAQSVEIFGLPFEVDQNKTSGMGLALNTSGNYQFDITQDTRLKVGGAFYDAEYKDRDFVDRQLQLYAGPRFLLENNAEISVLGTAARRWFGGKNLTEAFGVRVEGEKALGSRFLFNGAVSWQDQRYMRAAYADYSGPVASVNGVLTYAQASGFLRGIAGVVREDARLKPFSDTQYILGAGIYRHTLPYRFTAYLSTQVTLARYDAPLPAFGRTRHDTQVDTRVSISNAKLAVGRFTPIVTYVHTEKFSNIPIYAYSRDRVEMGFSWVF